MLPGSELAAIEKEMPRRAQQLVKVQEELKPLVETDARLSQQLKATRTQVEDTRSSLQANRSRWVGVCQMRLFVVSACV